MKTDEKDGKILALLSENSRMPNVDIAKKVGLTEGAVRSRIRKLVESGTIRRFTIDTEQEPGFYAVVMVKSRADTKKMMSHIASLKVHSDAYEISGQHDACVILRGMNMDDIDRKIDKIRKLKSVADTTTYVSFRRY